MRWTVKGRVANGARWLDENFPGWEDRINLNTLRLDDGELCICGQVFGRTPSGRKRSGTGYEWANRHLFEEANSWITPLIESKTVSFSRRSTRVSWALGFSAYGGYHLGVSNGPGYDALQREWVRVLKARAKARAKAAVSDGFSND
jgi:hypothetical protein